MNHFHAEDLIPYYEYELEVSAMNEFTVLSVPHDLGFGRETAIRTLEGGVCLFSSSWLFLRVHNTLWYKSLQGNFLQWFYTLCSCT